MSRSEQLVTILIAGALAACGGGHQAAQTAGNAGNAGSAAAADTRSLYERLGGTPAITAVVEELVTTTGADPRIRAFFINADVPKLEQQMVDQLCQATGGPCRYTGKDMKTAHAGMHITATDFDAFIDDLTKTLDKMKVPPREQRDVLAAFRGMQPDVVQP
jgi:hemoglobin